MGRDKALVEIRGQTMIVRAAAELASLTDEVVISASEPVRYESLGYPVIRDIYPGQGPLAGLHAAMAHTQRPLLLLLACDLPRVRSGFLSRLIELSDGFDAVLPRSGDGGVHPLCAVYRRTTLPYIEAALIQQMNKMTAFLENSPLKVRWPRSEEGFFEDEDLVNLNSPKDLDDYLAAPKTMPGGGCGA